MRRRGGFTLIEVMVSMGIFASVVAAFTALYLGAAQLAESSRNLTKATRDAQAVLEAMRNTAELNGVGAGAGVQGAYPAGADLTGILAWNNTWNGVPDQRLRLQNQRIRATYTGTDPLSVNVQVSWNERYKPDPNDPKRISMDTMLTNR